jgi:hypothetical protein
MESYNLISDPVVMCINRLGFNATSNLIPSIPSSLSSTLNNLTKAIAICGRKA